MCIDRTYLTPSVTYSLPGVYPISLLRHIHFHIQHLLSIISAMVVEALSSAIRTI